MSFMYPPMWLHQLTHWHRLLSSLYFYFHLLYTHWDDLSPKSASRDHPFILQRVTGGEILEGIASNSPVFSNAHSWTERRSHNTVCSAGRTLDWKSKGLWFNPGFWQCVIGFRRSYFYKAILQPHFFFYCCFIPKWGHASLLSSTDLPGRKSNKENIKESRQFSQ